jgi:hypothetical protein
VDRGVGDPGPRRRVQQGEPTGGVRVDRHPVLEGDEPLDYSGALCVLFRWSISPDESVSINSNGLIRNAF